MTDHYDERSLDHAVGDTAGGGTVILGVDDLDFAADARHEREIVLDPDAVESSRFRVAVA